MAKLNLKAVLMKLGNRLVTEHGFMPAAHKGYGIPPGFNDPKSKATHLIAEFTEFVNNHPEAQEILNEEGFEWPVVARRRNV